MADTTKDDIICEAALKTSKMRQTDNLKIKKILENSAVIVSISAIFLSIILYAYNSGYCKIFNIPAQCMPIDLKSYIPFAINIISLTIYILYYISYFKADKLLSKNRFHPLRVLYGTIIVYYFLNYHNISNAIGNFPTIFIAIIIPLIIEIFFYLRNKPKKDKPITPQEQKIVLEDTVYDFIFNNLYIKHGLWIIVILVILATPFGWLKAKAKNEYQTLLYNDSLYAVIVDYDDKVLIQKADETNNVLNIKTDIYFYLSKENIEFTYKEYDKVIIEKNKNLEKETTSDLTTENFYEG